MVWNFICTVVLPKSFPNICKFKDFQLEKQQILKVNLLITHRKDLSHLVWSFGPERGRLVCFKLAWQELSLLLLGCYFDKKFLLGLIELRIAFLFKLLSPSFHPDFPNTICFELMSGWRMTELVHWNTLPFRLASCQILSLLRCCHGEAKTWND